MIHFGLKKVVYSVKIDNVNWTYGDERYKKLFKISFWRNSIAISYKPSQTRIDAFDLFYVRKFSGFKYIYHFATIHANREYTIKLKTRRIDNAFNVDVFEESLFKSHHADFFKYPFMLFGLLTKRKHKNISINKIED